MSLIQDSRYRNRGKSGNIQKDERWVPGEMYSLSIICEYPTSGIWGTTNFEQPNIYYLMYIQNI